MYIREATADDVEAIRAVHGASIRGLGPEGYDAEQVAAWAAGVEGADYGDVTDPDCHFVVAEAEGDVVGFGSLRYGGEGDAGDETEAEGNEGADPTDTEAEITGVYVHPDAARGGVGSALLAELEGDARDRGVDALTLQASLPAVEFYDHHGYHRVAERDHEFSAGEGTGVEGVVVEMRRRLD